MFTISQVLKKRVSITQAATWLSDLAGDDYLSQVFPGEVFPDSGRLRSELLFLAMYIIDAMLKSPTQYSWEAHKESVTEAFYLACAEKSGEYDSEAFVLKFSRRSREYSQGFARAVESVQQDEEREANWVVTGSAGWTFARICGFPDDDRYATVGAGAVVALRPMVENLIASVRLRPN